MSIYTKVYDIRLVYRYDFDIFAFFGLFIGLMRVLFRLYVSIFIMKTN